jgi:hypothetical protein
MTTTMSNVLKVLNTEAKHCKQEFGIKMEEYNGLYI